MQKFSENSRFVQIEQDSEEGWIGVINTYEVVGYRNVDTLSCSPPVEVPIVRLLESYRIPKTVKEHQTTLDQLPRAALRVQPKGRNYNLGLTLAWSGGHFGYATSVYGREVAVAIASDVRQGLLGGRASVRTVKGGRQDNPVWHIFYAFQAEDGL